MTENSQEGRPPLLLRLKRQLGWIGSAALVLTLVGIALPASLVLETLNRDQGRLVEFSISPLFIGILFMGLIAIILVGDRLGFFPVVDVANSEEHPELQDFRADLRELLPIALGAFLLALFAFFFAYKANDLLGYVVGLSTLVDPFYSLGVIAYILDFFAIMVASSLVMFSGKWILIKVDPEAHTLKGFYRLGLREVIKSSIFFSLLSAILFSFMFVYVDWFSLMVQSLNTAIPNLFVS